MEIEPNLIIGEVCPDASPMRHAETGDAPEGVSLPRRYELDAFVPLPDPRELMDRLDLSGSPSSVIHCREYVQPNWFTTRGVLLKRRQIELRGLPSFKRWRFITLTIDQDNFAGPLAAYLAGKERMRRFLDACRKAGLWKDETPWCWKMEFHKSGWPHWHLLVGRTKKFSVEEMQLIEKLWSLGGTSVEMVRQDDFLYSFKYAFKPVMQDDESGQFDTLQWTVPDWFLDYTGFKLVKVEQPDGSVALVEKPVTFQRVRFWQTSKGFYTGKKPDRKPRTEQKAWSIPMPVRVQADRANSSVQVVSRKRSGKYRKSAVILLACAAVNVWHLATWHAVGRNAVFLSVNSAVIPAHIITRNTHESWKLQPLLDQNRLSLRRAETLQRRQETLRRC